MTIEERPCKPLHVRVGQRWAPLNDDGECVDVTRVHECNAECVGVRTMARIDIGLVRATFDALAPTHLLGYKCVYDPPQGLEFETRRGKLHDTVQRLRAVQPHGAPVPRVDPARIEATYKLVHATLQSLGVASPDYVPATDEELEALEKEITQNAIPQASNRSRPPAGFRDLGDFIAMSKELADTKAKLGLAHSELDAMRNALGVESSYDDLWILVERMCREHELYKLVLLSVRNRLGLPISLGNPSKGVSDAVGNLVDELAMLAEAVRGKQ